MKSIISIMAACALIPIARAEEKPTPQEQLALHKDGSAKVADAQDELSADVQQLVIEQTNPKVNELLGEVKDIMNETTERLIKADTGGDTIAAQTEIIEKIHAAAKEKQSQGGGKSGGAMMDMMEKMMGKKSGEGQKPGEGQNGKPGDSAGKGQNGLSDTSNENVNGAADGKNAARRVPKAAGSANVEIPEEFRKAFDAYNRGAEKKVK